MAAIGRGKDSRVSEGKEAEFGQILPVTSVLLSNSIANCLRCFATIIVPTVHYC